VGPARSQSLYRLSYPPSSGAEAKIEWSYASTPHYAFMCA